MSHNSKIKSLIHTACLIGVPVFLLAPGRPNKEKERVFRGRNMAHRGLFSLDQSIPENSIPAFKKAVKNGYGMELDVQLSKDGKVVVFHDDTLQRMCGVDARVDDLTFKELRKLRLAGTDEKIPLFTEVLRAVHGREPIIVELKNGPRNKELCKKTLKILRKYRGETCVESFQPGIVAWFRFHAPDMFRGQLANPPQEYDEIPGVPGPLQNVVRQMLGCTMFNWLARPQFIAYEVGPKPLPVRFAEAMGAVKVAWTSHSKDTEKDYDVVIFEHYLPKKRFK